MESFKEVSLGFAEFVSVLIQETFDAVMSSQNYQIEQYNELERNLNLSNVEFAHEFISSEHVVDRMEKIFGSKISIGSPISKSGAESFNNLYEPLVINATTKLNEEVFSTIVQSITQTLVVERKDVINHLLNKSNVSNLVVDSGEITAKLELSNVYQVNEDPNTPDESKTRKVKPKTKLKKLEFGHSEKTKYDEIRGSVKIKEVIDLESNQTTLLVDKKEVLNAAQHTNLSIPAFRLIARPVKLTNNSNLFTEVKIRFKTV